MSTVPSKIAQKLDEFYTLTPEQIDFYDKNRAALTAVSPAEPRARFSRGLG